MTCEAWLKSYLATYQVTHRLNIVLSKDSIGAIGFVEYVYDLAIHTGGSAGDGRVCSVADSIDIAAQQR